MARTPAPSPFRTLLFISVVSTLFMVVTADRRFTILNSCPESIPVFINGASQGTLASGETITRTFEDGWNGFVYTNANAPNSPGNSGLGTTRVVFVNQGGYYYILKDPSQFNTGVSIVPDSAASDGFCPRLTCNSPFCANSRLEALSSFPAPGGTPPEPPLFACSTEGFTIRFCPSDALPRTDGTVNFHPTGNTRRCLSVSESPTNGTSVHVSDCSDSASQRWRFIGSGDNAQVELIGTGFCLDAGSSPADGIPLKLWSCIPDLPAQSWTYTPRSQLVVRGTGLCVDSRDGVQTFGCANGTPSQIWTVS